MEGGERVRAKVRTKRRVNYCVKNGSVTKMQPSQSESPESFSKN